PVSGTNTGTCIATGTPSGGTFVWSVNTDRISLSSNVGQIITYTSANPSVTGQPTVISVTYTLNNVTTPPFTVGNIWVRQPTSLAVLSDAPTTVTCNVGSYTFSGPHRERVYDTRDQMGQSLSDAGISTTTVESFPYTTTCNNFTLTTGNPNTPRFTDTLEFCAS